MAIVALSDYRAEQKRHFYVPLMMCPYMRVSVCALSVCVCVYGCLIDRTQRIIISTKALRELRVKLSLWFAHNENSRTINCHLTHNFLQRLQITRRILPARLPTFKLTLAHHAGSLESAEGCLAITACSNGRSWSASDLSAARIVCCLWRGFKTTKKSHQEDWISG